MLGIATVIYILRVSRQRRIANQQLATQNTPDLPQVIAPDDLMAQVKQSHQQIVDILAQLNKLQQEIRVLRGQVAEQAHKKRQIVQRPSKPTARAQATDHTQAHHDQNILQQQQAYQNAYQLISHRQYSQAIVAMQALLHKYPNSVYAVNAHYWLGELYLISGNTKAARREFTTVIKQYPQSAKVADALLKIGLLDYDQGKWTAAKASLTKVNKEFPNSAAARLAQARLHKLTRAGH